MSYNKFSNDENLYLLNPPEFKTIKEFLTYFLLDNYGARATYFENQKLHCQHGKMRSFDDIFNCCKTYFPNITVPDLMSELLILNRKKIYLWCCINMMRIRITFYTNLTSNTISENAFSALKYNSKYSWSELLKMVGLSTQNKFKEFLEKKYPIYKNIIFYPNKVNVNGKDFYKKEILKIINGDLKPIILNNKRLSINQVEKILNLII